MIGRVFRIVRVPITLLVLLGVLMYGAWWGYSNVIKQEPPAPPTPCVQQTVQGGVVRTTQVTVSVFNGGNRRGLARDVGSALRDKGFRVSRMDNTGEKVGQTVIVGAAATNPEVLLVAGFFKKATIRVDKTKTDRSVDVLVGDRYSGFNKGAKTGHAVKAKTVCLPAQASPNAALGN